MTEEQAWTAVGGPLLVGLTLWIIAELVRAYTSKVTRRRIRRRQIISLMGRARAVAFRAIRDGQFDDAYVLNSEAPTAEARAQYDDLTAQALDLFERDEQAVAFWTAVEFYAGWLDPFQRLRDSDVPHEYPARGRLISIGLHIEWQLARPQELIEWADARWPLARGNRRGPRYGHASAVGDVARHNVVIPNSDVTTDMLRPWVAYLPDHRPFPPLSRREARRLREKYPQHSEKYSPVA